MARADTYGDLAKLEQLLDEYATVQALDPAKVPDRPGADLGRWSGPPSCTTTCTPRTMPDDDDFDDFVLHIDGYLCEVKDVQIRDGLHILGRGARRRGRGSTWSSRAARPAVWGGTRRPARPAAGPRRRAYGLDEQALLAEPGARLAVPAALTDAGGRAGRAPPPTPST